MNSDQSILTVVLLRASAAALASLSTHSPPEAGVLE
jgi:hypothetical protein